MNKKDAKFMNEITVKLLEATNIDDIHKLKEEIVGIYTAINFKVIEYESNKYKVIK